MNDTHRPSLKTLEVWFLSFFGLGLLPKAPGTFGTLGILPVLYLLGKFKVPSLFLGPVFVLMTVGACLIADAYQKRFNLKDPQFIVIDEVIGMLLAWMIAPTKNLLELFILFALFRFFDIVKFWPASYFDKLEHGAGTILDDVVSGIFAGTSFLVVQFLYHSF